MKYYISPPPTNPVLRMAAAIMAALALAGAFFVGLAALIILVAVFSLLALCLFLRSWWRGRASGDVNVATTRTPADGDVIDAEYTVVSRRRN